MEHLIGYLPYALFLACPISMGAMMWYMARKPNSQHGDASSAKRIARLEREIETLRHVDHRAGGQRTEQEADQA